MSQLRLDQFLVDHGHFPSRSRARDAIVRGTVTLNGRTATKPGQPVSKTCKVSIDDTAQGYVSRAALKLLHGLDRFGFSPAGLNALDLGASSGGFTQVLLERGAAHVSALDVGHGQLAESLRHDARVRVLEGFNARTLQLADLPYRPDAIVCDVSFISLKLALPGALALAKPGAWLITLVKPQFEAGRKHLGKRGVVSDVGVLDTVCREIEAWLGAQPGWSVLGLEGSPITGSSGNREFRAAARKA